MTMNLRGCATLTEEAIWLFGAQAILSSKRGPSAAVGQKSQSFPDGGRLHRGSSELPQQMVIDAGPQGTGRSGHGHADALSVRLSFRGRRWLVDAGTCCYIGPGDRAEYISWHARSQYTDGRRSGQAEPEGPFAWSSIPKTARRMWNISGREFHAVRRIAFRI